jgi:hypothetical protein
MRIIDNRLSSLMRVGNMRINDENDPSMLAQKTDRQFCAAANFGELKQFRPK